MTNEFKVGDVVRVHCSVPANTIGIIENFSNFDWIFANCMIIYCNNHKKCMTAPRCFRPNNGIRFLNISPLTNDLA
jgi:hypothetical protein